MTQNIIDNVQNLLHIKLTFSFGFNLFFFFVNTAPYYYRINCVMFKQMREEIILKLYNFHPYLFSLDLCSLLHFFATENVLFHVCFLHVALPFHYAFFVQPGKLCWLGIFIRLSLTKFHINILLEKLHSFYSSKNYFWSFNKH